MLKWFVRRQLDAFEKDYGYDAAYMREMLDTSFTGLRRYAAVSKMVAHREDVPLDTWYAAKIVAILAEDCGPCTQLTVTMADREGVPQAVLRAILAGDEAGMGEQALLGVRYARAVLAHDPQADTLREEIVRRWGPRAVVSLALGIAASRVFPTVKYALGHGKACSRVRVGNAETRPLLNT